MFMMLQFKFMNMATDILVNIGSGNGLSLLQPQAITWTNDDLEP